MSMQVRRANSADAEDVVASLTEGFSKDPLLTWIFKTEELYGRYAPQFYRWLFEQTVQVGDVYIAEGRGALLGQLSSTVDTGEQQESIFREQAHALAPECADRLFAWLNTAQRNHPMDTAHWYATYQGVREKYRKHATGISLFRFAIQEHKTQPIYAESTTLRNLLFWNKMGFKSIGTFTIKDGVSLTQIWREPSDD